MKKLTSGLAILATALLVLPVDAAAQRGPRGGWGPGMRGGPDGPGVEAVMRLRDRLELTDEQVEQLEGLRRESVERRTAHRAQMEELRSQLAAGEIERDALRDVMETRREASEAMRTQMRERIDAILTEAQRDELQDLRDQGRAYMRGRASMQRGGRGFRSGRGAGMRGSRGFERDRMGPWHDRWGPPARDRRPLRRGGIG